MSATRRDVWVHMLLYPRHTLPTAIAPVLVASALAHHDGVFAWRAAVAAVIAGFFVQLGGVITDNFNNLRRHQDDREHPKFAEAMKSGVVTFGELKAGITACYALAVLAGAYLVYVGGVPAFVTGLASIAASLLYSSGPKPLGDNWGLGDPLFFVFFGLVSVMATYYCEAASVHAAPLTVTIPPGTVTLGSFLVSLPVAALCTSILVIDNIRDLEFDAEKNERTLAVIIGPRASRVEYVLLGVLAYGVPVILRAFMGFSSWILLPLLSIPYAIIVGRRVLRARTHEDLIPMTPQQGQVLIAHSVLATIGIALG